MAAVAAVMESEAVALTRRTARYYAGSMVPVDTPRKIAGTGSIVNKLDFSLGVAAEIADL